MALSSHGSLDGSQVPDEVHHVVAVQLARPLGEVHEHGTASLGVVKRAIEIERDSTEVPDGAAHSEMTRGFHRHCRRIHC